MVGGPCFDIVPFIGNPKLHMKRDEAECHVELNLESREDVSRADHVTETNGQHLKNAVGAAANKTSCTN